MLIEVTTTPISPGLVAESLDRSIHGAIVTFTGTTRRYTDERAVRFLDYEAYPQMAESKLHEVAEDARVKFGLEDISVVHRIGRLYVGEASLVVAVASPHRKEAFEACLYTVERIKEIVPIWKKEVWDTGSIWVRSEEA